MIGPESISADPQRLCLSLTGLQGVQEIQSVVDETDMPDGSGRGGHRGAPSSTPDLVDL